MYPNQQHPNFQMRNGFNNHVEHNSGLLAASPSSVALMGRNNSTDSGEKPNFIALFDYEQVIFNFNSAAKNLVCTLHNLF